MHVSEPDKSHMSLLRIDNERQIRELGIDQMAKELWGGPVTREFPIYAVFHKQRMVGFFQALQQTCVYPAIHPEMMKPREFVKVVKSLTTEMKRHVGNPLFLLCDKAAQIGEKGMRMVRLKKAKETAYVFCEEDK
jgi:hypothetical protein